MTVYTLSHMAWLLVSGDKVNPAAGGVGLLFFLVVLTQFNDVAQYCWGKLFGRHKVTLSVSVLDAEIALHRRHGDVASDQQRLRL